MKKIIVIGDSMIDRYLYASMTRISPEAPIPIHNIHSSENKLGGAANLVINLKNILPNHLSLHFFSICGSDSESIILKELLSQNNIDFTLIEDPSRKTTVKTRTYIQNHMVSRFDSESTHPIDHPFMLQIYEQLGILFQNNLIECIILSDYNKGMISIGLSNSVISLSNSYNIPVFIDPKTHDIDKYKNCFLIKPNLYEAKLMTHKNNISDICIELYNLINPSHILITCGSEGMVHYYDFTQKEYKHQNTNIQVTDVTGCGDAVFAVLIIHYLQTKNIEISIQLANYIGSLSVQNIGTYICSQNDINSFFQLNTNNKTKYIPNNKIIHFHKTNTIFHYSLKNIKKDYSSIIFTNGCFDILHIGHLNLLKYSKSLGDFLIVGLNSDSSIKRLKGNSRPINNQNDRSQFLSLLDFIDLIVIFEEDTPKDLLEYIKPHTIVKGGDYTPDSVIGKEHCQNVVIYPLLSNYSTSHIIQKILT